MNTHETDVQDTSANTSLLTQLAELDVELANALQLQQDTNQASNWSYYAWTTTDGLIERTKSQELIKRFEKQSIEADALKVLADALVKDLRERKRKLNRQLKSKAYSVEMQAIAEKAVQKSNNTAIAIAETLEKALKKADANQADDSKDALESAGTQENAKVVETTKPQKKRSLKNAAIAK